MVYRNYNQILEGTLMTDNDMIPRRWRVKLADDQKHPNGSTSRYFHGCYFPLTDLCIGEMARPRTGVPRGVEWLDEPTELMKECMR